MTGIVARWWYGLCALLLCQCLHAEVLQLEDGLLESRLPMGSHISQYVGHDSPNDVRAAAELPDSDFSPVGAASPTRAMHTSWFRFAVHNPSTRVRSLVLDFDQALFNRVEWHAVSATSTKYVLTGQDYSDDSRDVDYDYFAFRVDVPAGETLVVNFSLYSLYATLFVPTLADSDAFIANITLYNRVLGAIMGMLYSVALFMLFYLFYDRGSRLAQGMFGFALMSMFSVLYVCGAVQRWLPDTTGFAWSDAAYVVIHSLQGLSFVVVVRLFYLVGGTLPWVDRLLQAVMVVQVGTILSLPFASLEWLPQMSLAANTAGMLVAQGLAIWAILTRRENTYLFSTGLLISMILMMISVLASQGLLPASVFSRYGYELGLTIQVDFIFLAAVLLMSRSVLLQQHADAAVLKLNAEIAAREKFVAQVTHDIKSPLAAVVGAEELLRDEKDQQKQQRFLDIVRDSSQLVLRMVDDMLSHSSLQHGRLQLQPQRVDMPVLLSQWEAMFATIPRQTKVQFEFVRGEGLPEHLLADSLRLTQLISNLVTNAFKFTEQGYVSLCVEQVSREGGNAVLRFTVKDTGIGMSEEFLAKAFAPYAREETRIAGRRGFGLGLSICSQLVELMQGTIQVESKPGDGSCFTVELPFLLVD